MSHLLGAETKGLFSTTVPERPSTRPEYEGGMVNPIHPPANAPVHVVMTPHDAAMLLSSQGVRAVPSSAPHYDALCTSNLSPRTRGKHY